MNLHSVFLRKGCILPDGLHPRLEPCGEDWTLVDKITAQDFYTAMRQWNWHYVWMLGSCSRRGLGRTPETAIQRALERALNGIARRYNSAELVAVRASKYSGFHIAKVTVEPRKVQHFTSMDIAIAMLPHPVHAK